MLQYTFTATPVNGGTPITVTSTDPDVRFYGLQPNTEASETALNLNSGLAKAMLLHHGMCTESVT